MEGEYEVFDEKEEEETEHFTQDDNTKRDEKFTQKDETEQSKRSSQIDKTKQQQHKTVIIDKAEDQTAAEEAIYDDEYPEYEDYEHVPEYEEAWEEKVVTTEAVDWEKEAKQTVHLDTSKLREKRITIFELDSYVSSGPSVTDLHRLASKEYSILEPRKGVRYSDSLGAPGIARINLSPLTQKVIGCVIGENVSTEYPWVYVRKEIIEDNIDLHEESSDFLPIKEEIHKFPNTKILIGYVPSLSEHGQFYICLTEEGQDAVIEHIQKQREEHENRVRTAVYKPSKEWQDLGSGTEIQASIVENTRPFLEIELIGTADVLNTPLQLQDRKVDDVRDGYIELLPSREVFEIIPRKLLSNMIQATPAVRDIKIQTALSVLTNCWVQYEYTYESPDIATFTEEQLESLRSFLLRFTDHVCDQLLLNATWDIYTDDYGNLVRNIRDTQWPIPVSYEEHLSLHDEKHVVDKVINDLCWHPLWTGIAFAAYTSFAKSQYLAGPKSDAEIIKSYENNFVLVWSFNDCLAPKLLLECPREVTSVAVCPMTGTLVVGGCVVLWHISGKIEKVEAIIVHTAAQIKHKITLKSLTKWMKELLGTSVVRPTAMSSLKDSQKAPVTQIIWIPSYDMLDSNGRIVSLPEDTDVKDLSSQFMSASEDGTIAFWNLKLEKWQVHEKKARKIVQVKRPEALAQSISPYKKLDRTFKPHYILTVHHPNENRNVVITTITVWMHKFKKKRVDVGLSSKDVTIRKYFKNIIKKPTFVMQPYIHVGTVEGDFGCVTWEGYDFTTDLTINSEICRWTWSKKIHDGPITHSVRSKQNGRWIATIGGKIFAIWKDDLGIPLIWKKSNVNLTALSWGSHRPSILILTRTDGSVELWDFMVKSEEPCVVQSLSGRIITGIYTHELYSTPQCVGFCDFNGILRMFLAPGIFQKKDPTTVKWMNNFIDRQIKRVITCKNWSEKWLKANYKYIEEKQKLAKDAEKRKQLKEREMTSAKLLLAEAVEEPQRKSLKPWELIEQAREKWKERELKHMQQVLLEKKGLKKEDLERQREPILRLRQDAKRKREKLKATLKMQQSIFEHTKNRFFPKHRTESKKLSLIPMLRKIDDQLEEDSILAQEVLETPRFDPAEEIIYHFMETQTKVLADLQKNPYQYSFNWKNLLMKGKLLRASLDIELRKLNKAKRKSSAVA